LLVTHWATRTKAGEKKKQIIDAPPPLPALLGGGGVMMIMTKLFENDILWYMNFRKVKCGEVQRISSVSTVIGYK